MKNRFMKSRSRLSRRTLALGLICALSLSLPLTGRAQYSPPEPDDGGSRSTHPTFVLSGTVQRNVRAEPGMIGLDMAIRGNHYPQVQSVFQGSPAHRKGMLPGDEIIAIDGVSTLGRSIYEIDALISDVPGTPVKLTLHRFNALREVELIVAPVSQAGADAGIWVD